MRLFSRIGITLIVFLITITAHAQSIEQKDAMAQYTPKFKEAADSVNSRCGSRIAAKIDWNSFYNESWDKHNPAAWCIQALDSIGFQCGDSAALKSAIAAKVQNFSCAKGATGKPLFSFNAHTVTYSLDWNASNVEEKLLAFLKKGL